jgi:hypothetical protein
MIGGLIVMEVVIVSVQHQPFVGEFSLLIAVI